VDNSQISLETLSQIRKAQTTGITSATGITGVDLRDLISLVPAPSSFYNTLAQTSPDQAGPYAMWRVLTDINNQQADPGVAFDYASPLNLVNMMNVSAAYAKIGTGYTVTKDAEILAKGFADARAIEVFNAMNTYKIGADNKALWGQNFALPTPAVATTSTVTTGGTVAAATYLIRVAARTGSNYKYGGSTAAAANASQVTTGATSTLTASVPAIPGAVAYDWYVNGFYNTTTVVNTVTWTTTPAGSNQPVPASLPSLYQTAPTAVPAVDSSAKLSDFNGLLATLAGDYATGGASGLVTRGSGTNSGAIFQSLDGAGFTASGQNIAALDKLNAAIFAKTFLSPDAYMCSAVDAAAISSLLLGNGAGNSTFFTPGSDGRSDVTAGGFIGHYINKSAGGLPVRVEVHPNMIPGTLIARTDHVNFPNSNISNVFELRSLEPLQDYLYGSGRVLGQAGGGPRTDGEVFSTSTLINRAPVAQAVLSNILS